MERVGVDEHTANTSSTSGSAEAGLHPMNTAATAIMSERKDSTAVSPGEPADGGLHAWLRVLGAFLVLLNAWGLIISFGAFQIFYEENLLHNYSSSTIAWIGTLQAALLLTVGLVAGPLFDLGYYKQCVYVGSCLSMLGIMMLSISKQYYAVFLSQGLCLGLGNGLLYVPSLALMNMSFTSRRAIAMGISSAGVPIGGVLYTLLFENFVPSVGFAWTVRIMGFFALIFFLIATPCLLCGPKQVPGQARALLDKKAFRDVPYLIFTSSNFFIFFGYIVPYFFIPTFAQAKLGSSTRMSLYLLVITQAGSLLGRPIIGFIAVYTGVMLPWLICATASGILCLAWVAIDSVAGFAVFCAIFGFVSGPLVSLPPSIFPVICPDLKTMGTRMGMSWCWWSLATLCGAPIGGALVTLNASPPRLIGLQLWSGLCLLFGGAQMIPLWFMVKKRAGRWLI